MSATQHGNQGSIIATREVGWVYLVSVLDLHNHQVVGWTMGQHHDAQLATATQEMALQRSSQQKA